MNEKENIFISRNVIKFFLITFVIIVTIIFILNYVNGKIRYDKFVQFQEKVLRDNAIDELDSLITDATNFTPEKVDEITTILVDHALDNNWEYCEAYIPKGKAYVHIKDGISYNEKTRKYENIEENHRVYEYEKDLFEYLNKYPIVNTDSMYEKSSGHNFTSGVKLKWGYLLIEDR